MPVTHILQYKGGTGAIAQWIITGDGGVENSWTTGGDSPGAYNNAGIHFSPDGTKMFTSCERSGGWISELNYKVNQYTLGTPWDIGTRSLDFEFSRGTLASWGTEAISFNPIGTRMYIQWTENIYQYDLGTAWDLTTANNAVFTLTPINVPVPFSLIGAPRFNNDGTTAYFAADSGVYSYTLSTAYDITTISASHVDFTSWTGGGIGLPTGAEDIFFNPSGSELYTVDHDRFYKTPLTGTAFDITNTGTPVLIIGNMGGENAGHMFISTDGDYLFKPGPGDYQYRHTLTTA